MRLWDIKNGVGWHPRRGTPHGWAISLLGVVVCSALVQCTTVGEFADFDAESSHLSIEPNRLLSDGLGKANVTLTLFYSPGVPADHVPVRLVASHAG